jgi:hypothetical protein
VSSSYWDSTEAKNLFRPQEDEENALIRINNQLQLLYDANSSPDAYLEVIDKGNNRVGDDDDEKLSEYQVWLVRQKILILTIGLVKAKGEKKMIQNWNTCCEEARLEANKYGFKAATCSRTIRNWYQEFRVKRKFNIQVL